MCPQAFPYLRRLNLSGNPCATLDFTGLSLLRHLDLSFCDGLEYFGLDLSPLVALTSLALDGCGIASLAMDGGVDGCPLYSVSSTLSTTRAYLVSLHFESPRCTGRVCSYAPNG